MFVKAYDGTLYQVSEESPVITTGLSFLAKQLREYATKHKIKQGSKLNVSYKELVFSVRIDLLSHEDGVALVKLHKDGSERIEIINF